MPSTSKRSESLWQLRDIRRRPNVLIFKVGIFHPQINPPSKSYVNNRLHSSSRHAKKIEYQHNLIINLCAPKRGLRRAAPQNISRPSYLRSPQRWGRRTRKLPRAR
jgi:hypothetical protein